MVKLIAQYTDKPNGYSIIFPTLDDAKVHLEDFKSSIDRSDNLFVDRTLPYKEEYVRMTVSDLVGPQMVLVLTKIR